MQNLFKYVKICSVCKKEKGICEFVMQRGKPQARCRECNNNKAKEHYHSSFLSSKKGSPWFYKYSIKLEKSIIKEFNI